MSMKYFTEMKEEMSLLQKTRNEMSAYSDHSNVMALLDMYKTQIRAMHMVKAYSRKIPMYFVECGNYNCGNFRKSLKEAIAFMKDNSGNNEVAKFISWVNSSLEKQQAGYKVFSKNDINVKDL